MRLLTAHTLVGVAQGPQVVQEQLLHGPHWPGGVVSDVKILPDINELLHDLLRLNVAHLAQVEVACLLLTAHAAGLRALSGDSGELRGLRT